MKRTPAWGVHRTWNVTLQNNKVKNVVKVLGLVASAPGFNSQPRVINGASELLIEVFGEAGRHARSAVGTNELPDNIPVEIEVIFEVE